MDESERYVSPFSRRYASLEMQRIFSEKHKFTLWRKLWILLAQSEKELGLPITDEQIAQMRAHENDVDLDAAARYEKELRHDVMAHVKAYGDQCPLAAPIIHLGATSCYVGDNADVLILREAVELIQKKLAAAARAVSAFARENAGTPVLAYTHFQPAQPTTVGKRAALWLYDLMTDIGECEHFLETLRPLGSKGTTGTQASFLSLFDGDITKVRALDDMIAQRLGFPAAVPVSGQTYSRKTDSRALDLTSQIGQSAHKFSTDIRLSAHEKEIEEPFESHQIGSSAMAYKRNPMRCERIAALSRFMIVNAQNAALTASEQWLERTLDDSANRRLSLAEGFLACDGTLDLYRNVASGLVTYPKMMEKHLRSELPFMATENLLMRCVKAGGDRQELHERIRVHSQAAAARVKNEGAPCDLIERLADDPAFRVTKEELYETLSPENFIGCAREQTLAYCDEADAMLARYPDSGAARDITV